MLPDAPEGHYISPVNSDPSPGRRAACNSSSEGNIVRMEQMLKDLASRSAE